MLLLTIAVIVALFVCYKVSKIITQIAEIIESTPTPIAGLDISFNERYADSHVGVDLKAS